MAQPQGDVPLPRNFKLLAEVFQLLLFRYSTVVVYLCIHVFQYEACIGKEPSFIVGEHTGLIQYGIDDSKDDPLLHNWQGIIFGPQGTQS
jgi:hypothetical protein